MRPVPTPEAASPPSAARALPDTVRLYLRLTRPFTLLPPLLGVISGAVTAWGSASNPHVLAGLPRQWTTSIVATIALGSICAAILNAASNVINQIHDLANDRINKPLRPLVTGEIFTRAARRFSWILYALAVVPTWLVVVYPHESLGAKAAAPIGLHQCAFIYLAGMLFTFVYSDPAFGRTKAHPLLANLTIAIPRGCLLKVAGWSMVASIAHLEPWFIGAVFFLFLLGASSTKDFSDMRGDEAAGCRTLPVQFGVRTSARIIAPFLVLPWVLLPVGAWASAGGSGRAILTGNPWVLTVLGILLALWGIYAAYLLLRNPEDLARVENHPSWTHMYLMMMVAQIGFAVAYLV